MYFTLPLCGVEKQSYVPVGFGREEHTVFPQSNAAATINFSFAGVRLLIEGGSYLRAAFINDTIDSIFQD